MTPSKSKATAPVVAPPPTVTDTTRQAQDAVDEMLRRRGLKSTLKTGLTGASLGSGQTAAATLLGS